MRALNAADILAVWESARDYHPVDQALALLAAADPQRPHDELAALPLGQRDAQLIALRQNLFGDHLPGRAQCPQCHEAVEFELSCRALRDSRPATATTERILEIDGYTLQLWPLDSHGLAAAARTSDIDIARHTLLARCVRSARCGEQHLNVNDLPEQVIQAVAQNLMDHDPQAELLIDLACPTCHHQWQSVLDMAQLLWTELAARAQRLLFEIHTLARAYGWREDDILALSEARRATYLDMVAA